MNNTKMIVIMGILVCVASAIRCVGNLSESLGGTIALLIVNCVSIGILVAIGWMK